MTLQALMDKEQWVWMTNWCCSGMSVFLLVSFCFLKHCVVCLSSLFKRRWRSKTTQNHDALFLQEEQLKLTETFSVMQVKVWGENDLNSDHQNMLCGLFIFQSFWMKSWRKRGNICWEGTVLSPQYAGGAAWIYSTRSLCILFYQVLDRKSVV